MANTTNFGWETPDDTDLVKDGAAAIRTLGSAIDTSLADLEGGTTGQILAKNSNTDMDFVWVTNDVGDITEVVAGTGLSGGGSSGSVTLTNTVATEFDAKGDLVVGTGADTFDKLTVGTNGHVLTADSTETTGVKWAAPASGGMTLLSTTTLTGSSVVLSTISGNYTNLYLVIKNVYLATASNCYLRLNNDSGNNYSFHYIRYRDTTAGIGYSYSDTLHGYLFEAPATNTVSKLANCEVVLPRYTDTDTQAIYTRSYGSTATQVVNYTSVGSYDNSAAITQIDIIPGANFSGGTAYLYGVK